MKRVGQRGWRTFVGVEELEQERTYLTSPSNEEGSSEE
jgi:hypothetical protein